MAGRLTAQSGLANRSQILTSGLEGRRLAVAFVMPRSSHARCVKRIQLLGREGITPTVLAFERVFLNVRIEMNQIPYTSLGLLEHRQYWRSLLRLLQALPTVASHANGCCAIYCFGLDLLVLGWFCRVCTASRALLVYEVADVLEVQCGKSLLSRLIRAVEAFLLRRAAALVITSPAYLDGYYRRFRRLPPVFLIENKFGHEIEPTAIEAVRATPVCRESGVITIGFFAAIRCMR